MKNFLLKGSCKHREISFHWCKGRTNVSSINEHNYNLYSTSTCSLKLASRIERTYTKLFLSRSMIHFQYRNDVLFFDFCVSQSYGDKSVSLTDQATRSLVKSAHSVICDVYLALFMLFTSTTAESPIMENLFSVKICTSPEPSIKCP